MNTKEQADHYTGIADVIAQSEKAVRVTIKVDYPDGQSLTFPSAVFIGGRVKANV